VVVSELLRFYLTQQKCYWRDLDTIDLTEGSFDEPVTWELNSLGAFGSEGDSCGSWLCWLSNHGSRSFHAWLLDASKELDTAKETISRASPTPAGVGLAWRLHFIPLTSVTCRLLKCSRVALDHSCQHHSYWLWPSWPCKVRWCTSPVSVSWGLAIEFECNFGVVSSLQTGVLNICLPNNRVRVWAAPYTYQFLMTWPTARMSVTGDADWSRRDISGQRVRLLWFPVVPIQCSWGLWPFMEGWDASRLFSSSFSSSFSGF